MSGRLIRVLALEKGVRRPVENKAWISLVMRSADRPHIRPRSRTFPD
jgi:hypothetical protein